ncbi:hypothetical protein FOVG_17570 [Fusarium oxysporum f. sp. pisi HDV247]|uniref:Uncharacterized protein n=1 Tax=Fusarium oxysporum f. sp. pisi HDV247 TaxID=1080344 RepID=W9NK14_FUSOX|nr:hypothetical protein FOVG_17570 [Fusarium oxysporum f. sp. pisi HDV247]
MITTFRSSSDANAVSWNWYICSTIAEISFDAAVITVRVIAFLNTSIRRVAVPMPSGRYTAALCDPFLSVLCDPVTSAIGSLLPDRTPHCRASNAPSSADRRSSCMLSASYAMRLGGHALCLFQMLLMSSDASHRNMSHGQRAECVVLLI